MTKLELITVVELGIVKSTNEKKIRERIIERQLENIRKTHSNQQRTVDLAEIARKKRN